jgi:ribose transport system permease protein
MLLWRYFKNRPIGYFIYATGGNEFAAYASGINIKQSKIMAFVLSSVFGVFAGLVLSGKTMSGNANIGNSYPISSIAGAVLGGASFVGGVGSISGAFAGGMIIAIIVNILFFLNVQAFWQHVVQGLILLGSVLIMSFSKFISKTKEIN